MSGSRPNILLFMVDQLTAQVLRPYGGSVCKTPNLDALAGRAALFENAYCNYPLCAPSRFSMMSGRLPSRIGAYDNGAEFTASTPTFAHYLRRLGYYTCISGKMHFVGPDQLHGFEERLTTEIYPADFSWTPTAGYADIETDDERRYAAGTSTVESVLDSAPMARTMQIDYDEDVVHHAVRELFVRARSEDKRPFLMTVSLTQPHDPYVTTREYWDRYDDAEIDPPRVPHIPLEQRDPHSRSLHVHYGQDRIEISEEAYRRARRGYYGMVSHVDALFGRLMAALGEAGFAENTVVVVTSDHGDMLGERGMWFKKTLYEPAIRVPLVIADPRRRAQRVTSPVSLVDLFPTLLDLADAPEDAVSTPLDGHSLVPLFDSDASTREVFVEHIDGGTVAPRVMVRSGSLKLVVSPAYPTLLFDLAADPDERNNLAGLPEVADAQARLQALAAETWDLTALAAEVTENQASRRVIAEASALGRVEAWDFQPRALVQNTRYVRRGDAFPTVERRGYLPYAKT
ncbi:choline-sulfatase [Pelagibius sp.]|uniref:choline-sulfatase n=1 Tax=Pelagibius sp. TaxID=1931238 RepID=UPI002625B454|nr:choline-sulfatase [Pelagibius sp.]